MIFITVGHQMPFDRLVKAVDEWAAQHGRHDLFAQTGHGSYSPGQFESAAFLSPTEFSTRMNSASAVVAHAGTGTILAALQIGKPLLVLPRSEQLQETRSNHQFPTAKHFADAGQILMAECETEVSRLMDELETFQPRAAIQPHASPQLIDRIRQFVHEGTK